RSCGGTGLGLSISARIMQEHGGRLDIQSCQGQGTRVRLCFPVQA
ncbi:MAG: ATP-binding protein, partial [Desulfovibrionales bacterium]|nr:ATP-binding protein [Desulfovibrionales bacterium]